MIDIHAHILPGVDDGPRDMDEALDMCKACVDDGITSVIATPHDHNGMFTNDRASILEKTKELEIKIKGKNLALNLYPGADITMNPELPALLDENRIMTLNDTGKYLLLEPPVFFHPDALKRLIFEIKLRGITPIITHPERNETLMSHFDALYEAIISGALIQITASSLTGHFGMQARKHSIDLLKAKMVHFIASDSHNTDHRKPGLSSARLAVSTIVGEEESWEMVREHPLAVLKGEPLEFKEPEKPGKRRGLISFFMPWRQN
jgi:protein-tyrosine phosphatase